MYITHINHLIIIIDSIDYAKARAIVIYVDPGDVLSQFIHHMNWLFLPVFKRLDHPSTTFFIFVSVSFLFTFLFGAFEAPVVITGVSVICAAPESIFTLDLLPAFAAEYTSLVWRAGGENDQMPEFTLKGLVYLRETF